MSKQEIFQIGGTYKNPNDETEFVFLGYDRGTPVWKIKSNQDVGLGFNNLFPNNIVSELRESPE